MINWEEQAVEYLKEYGNDDTYIREWVNGLVPSFENYLECFYKAFFEQLEFMEEE